MTLTELLTAPAGILAVILNRVGGDVQPASVPPPGKVIPSSPITASPEDGVMNESMPLIPDESLGGGEVFVCPRTPNDPPVTLSLLKFIVPLTLLRRSVPIEDEVVVNALPIAPLRPSGRLVRLGVVLGFSSELLV